jgi:nitrite reductase/ring-hydroxylating ferredoxin subunit
LIAKQPKTRVGKRSALAAGDGLRFSLTAPARSRRASCVIANPAKSGFAIEYSNTVYAYENRCPHLGVELDWAPGAFFDDAKDYLVCSTHGAHFEPHTGKCVSGPCIGQSLTALSVVEEKGDIYIQDAHS